MAQTIEEILLKIKVQGKKDLRDIKSGIKDVGDNMTAANVKGNLYADGIKLILDNMVDLGKAFIANADTFTNYTNQLNVLTGSQAETARTMELLRDVAITNRAAFGDTIDLYTKLSLATESLGKSQEEIIAATSSFQKALALSGADANTASGAIRQFGQAMASGQVRGDEFNSIVEALGPALNIMARETGISVGELRNMSQAGELTSEAFFKMLTETKALNEAMALTTRTSAQFGQILKDSFAQAGADINESTGATGIFNQVLYGTSRIVDGLFGNLTETAKASNDELRNSEDVGLALAEAYFRLGQEENALFRDTDKYKEAADLVAELEQKILDQGDAAEKQAIETKRFQQALSSLKTELKDALSNQSEYNKIISASLSPLDKLNTQITQAESDIESLSAALQKEGADHIDVANKLDIATQAHKLLIQERQNLINQGETLDEYGKFYLDILDTVDAEAKTIENLNYALQDLATQREILGDEKYAAAVALVNERLEKYKEETKETTKEIQTLAEFQKALTDEVDESARTQEYATQSIDIYRQALEDVGYTTEEVAQKIQDYKDQFGLETEISAIEAFNQKWKELSNDATDEIKMAQEQASILFGGMEDAIDQLVDNGKINFSSLVDSMIKDMIRAQLKAAATDIFSSVLGGGNIFSSIGKVFGGLFADGGYLPSGKVGIVGEEGPEFISGPANITPMDKVGGGSQTINYNINAVDARSFKQMVAADPEFIHSIAMTGARNMPNRRRV
jgi:lambda family phage tail tape measure protein